MPTPNEGHPYRTPCAKCLEKDELLLKEDKKIKDWARAYNELVDRYNNKMELDPDQAVARWFGIFFVLVGVLVLFGWLVYHVGGLNSSETGGLVGALGAFLAGGVILWANRIPKLKK